MAERRNKQGENSLNNTASVVDNTMSNVHITNNNIKVEEVEEPSDEEYDYSNEPDQFPCRVCSSRFVTKLSLARHMIVHEHEIEIEKIGNENHVVKLTFICSFCDLGFDRGEDLASHVSKEHRGATFGCPHCSRNFSRKDYLMKHIENDHFTVPDESKNTVHENNRHQVNHDNDDADNNNEEEELDDINDNEGYEYQDHEDQDDDYIEPSSYLQHDQLYGDVDGDSDNSSSNDVEFASVSKNNNSINYNNNGNRGDQKVQCPECGVVFMTREILFRHMHSHISNRPHKCSICEKGFVRKEHLTKHLSSVHSGMKFTCSFCGKDISRKDHLIRHIRNVHPLEFSGIPEELPLNMMQNAVYNGNTTNNSSLDKAIESLQPKPKKPYLSCDMCDSTFTTLNTLYEHQATIHSDVRRFKCEFCPKAFKRKEHLRKHNVLHTGTKEFPCMICFKEFPRKDALQDHMRRMHGQKSGFLSLPSSSSLSSSSKSMSCSNPLKNLVSCNFCNKRFASRKNLASHMKAHHDLVLSFPIRAQVEDDAEDINDFEEQEDIDPLCNFNSTETNNNNNNRKISSSQRNSKWTSSQHGSNSTTTTTTTLYV